MTFRVKERALPMAVAMTTAVVIVLAGLQYRWSNELSEATGVRLADTLQLSMINWHSDFLRNFSELCLTWRIDPESGTNDNVNRYTHRFAEWRAVARYPNLVANVYLLTGDESSPLRTLWLNPSTNLFEPKDWSFSSMLSGKITEPSVQATSQPVARSFIGEAVRGWWFEPSLPALVHPTTHKVTASAGQHHPPRETAEWVVIELSDKAIQTEILPDLANRYFQGTDGLDYQVAVVAGSRPRHVIYSSDPGFGEHEVADADGTMNVFGRAGTMSRASSIEVFHKTSGKREPVASASISWFPLVRETPEDQDWQLVVRHRRGGPLGAFVADMYRRDLVISFGALVFLVVSVAMLIVTSNRAQRLAKLQMDFVTAVSHELRTPLTVISSAADNIAHGVVEGKDQLAQYGSVIGNQAKQLSGLVEQILLFAASNKSPQRLSLQPIDVHEIIDATLASTAGLIEAAQFSVESQIEPGLPKVMGDLVALSQCLQNLMTNALKYGRNQRWIGIRARVAEHGASGKEVQVSISDRGLGIESEDLPHIFEPFYRSPSVAAAQTHGTGLGLTLAKRIAEAMKGQLTVTSEPGRGSTFTLHLPCTEQLTRGSD
jgi:signal transduction histidine kinase